MNTNSTKIEYNVDIQKGVKLGDGEFGIVYEVTSAELNERLAFKTLQEKGAINKKCWDEFIKEYNITKNAREKVLAQVGADKCRIVCIYGIGESLCVQGRFAFQNLVEGSKI